MQWEIIGIFVVILGAFTAMYMYMFNSLKGDIRDTKHDLEKLFEARLTPINEKLGNHITDTNKEIAELKKGQAKLEQGQKTILEKLDTINKSG